MGEDPCRFGAARASKSSRPAVESWLGHCGTARRIRIWHFWRWQNQCARRFRNQLRTKLRQRNFQRDPKSAKLRHHAVDVWSLGRSVNGDGEQFWSARRFKRSNSHTVVQPASRGAEHQHGTDPVLQLVPGAGTGPQHRFCSGICRSARSSPVRHRCLQSTGRRSGLSGWPLRSHKSSFHPAQRSVHRNQHSRQRWNVAV